MKKAILAESFLVLLAISIPFFYLATVYNMLPPTVPIHFDIKGNPNGYSGKQSLWVFLCILAALSFGTYQLIINLQKIDPKRAAGQSSKLLRKIAITVLVIMTVINLMIVYAAKGGPMNISGFMLQFLGLVFLVIGNFMHSIKPNYFVGFRLPWTMEDPENWRKTHQVVSKVWVTGGLLIFTGAFLLPQQAAYIFFVAMLSLMVIMPAVYSYNYFKKNKKS